LLIVNKQHYTVREQSFQQFIVCILLLHCLILKEWPQQAVTKCCVWLRRIKQTSRHWYQIHLTFSLQIRKHMQDIL